MRIAVPPLGSSASPKEQAMLRKVRLELARCHDFPEGSRRHGYELNLPLTSAGKLDRNAFEKDRPRAGFHRFWGSEEERQGVLFHHRQGWRLSFSAGDEADEVIFRGDDHRFTVGDYVSIKEHDGETRTFRVVAVS
jgi:hypothetical protein